MLLLFSILAAWGGSRGRREPWRGYGAAANGEESKRGRGGCNPIGEKERGGSHPPDRDQWPKLALPFELPTPAEKISKDLLFSEECLLKLQTPMPQNMKEKRKISLTSFQKIRVSHGYDLWEIFVKAT
jgi:hypothetical protein